MAANALDVDVDAFIADVRAESDAHRSRVKGTCWLIDTLDAVNDRLGEALLAMLTDPRVTGAAIAKKLSALGRPVASQTVNRHKKRECQACAHLW